MIAALNSDLGFMWNLRALKDPFHAHSVDHYCLDARLRGLCPEEYGWAKEKTWVGEEL